MNAKDDGGRIIIKHEYWKLTGKKINCRETRQRPGDLVTVGCSDENTLSHFFPSRLSQQLLNIAHSLKALTLPKAYATWEFDIFKVICIII